jgi:hypothetical protein
LVFPAIKRRSAAFGFGGMIERLQELLPVSVRQTDRCFFHEMNLVLRYYARFADPQLVLVHLLNDDCRTSKGFGQANPPLCVSRPDPSLFLFILGNLPK